MQQKINLFHFSSRTEDGGVWSGIFDNISGMESSSTVDNTKMKIKLELENGHDTPAEGEET